MTALDAGVIVIPFRFDDIADRRLAATPQPLDWLDALSPPLDQHIDNLIEIASGTFRRGGMPKGRRLGKKTSSGRQRRSCSGVSRRNSPGSL